MALMDPRKTRLFWIAIFCLGAVNVAAYWGYFIDDAYISFRYLRNWLAGDGLVFNPGEKVESFSNFLWIAILYPFGKVGVPLTLASRVVGALFYGATILLGKRLIDQVNPAGTEGENFVSPLLIATCPHLGFWATGGLETVAFSFFICLSAYLAIRDSFTVGEQILLPLSCFSLVLCRPEGIAIAGLCYAYKIWQQRKKAVWGSAFVFGALLLGGYALRYGYYGEFLPHTFYAKADTLLVPLKGASSYTFGVLSSVGGVVALLCPVLVFFKLRRLPVWFLYSLLGFYVAFQFRFGWDWMPFYRFFTPYLPLFFALYALFNEHFLKSAKAKALFVAGVVVWMNAWSVHYLKDGAISAFYEPEKNDHPYYQIARELDKITDESEYVFYEEMGLIPFYSKAKFLDAIGLTDKYIGRKLYDSRTRDGGGIAEYFERVFDYVKEKNPKVIIIASVYSVDNPLFAETLKKTWPHQVYHSPWFAESYQYLKSFGKFRLFIRKQ